MEEGIANLKTLSVKGNKLVKLKIALRKKLNPVLNLSFLLQKN